MDAKYDPVDLMLDTYDYANWLEKEESDDTTLKDNDMLICQRCCN